MDNTRDHRSPPPIQDRAEDILSAWTAIEVLSPQPYRKPSDMTDGDERRVAQLGNRRALPWAGQGEKSLPKRRLLYQIVLGAIRMEDATKARSRLLSISMAIVRRHADSHPLQPSPLTKQGDLRTRPLRYPALLGACR
jgi:hypothetical protein